MSLNSRPSWSYFLLQTQTYACVHYIFAMLYSDTIKVSASPVSSLSLSRDGDKGRRMKKKSGCQTPKLYCAECYSVFFVQTKMFVGEKLSQGQPGSLWLSVQKRDPGDEVRTTIAHTVLFNTIPRRKRQRKFLLFFLSYAKLSLLQFGREEEKTEMRPSFRRRRRIYLNFLASSDIWNESGKCSHPYV